MFDRGRDSKGQLIVNMGAGRQGRRAAGLLDRIGLPGPLGPGPWAHSTRSVFGIKKGDDFVSLKNPTKPLAAGIKRFPIQKQVL